MLVGSELYHQHHPKSMTVLATKMSLIHCNINMQQPLNFELCKLEEHDDFWCFNMHLNISMLSPV